MLVKQGNLVEARAAFDAACRVQPDAAAIQLNLARLDILEKRTDAARSRLNAVLGKHPGSVLGRLLVAEVEAGDRQYRKSVDAYREVLKMDPKNVTALNNAAALLSEELGDLEQALTYAQQAVDQAPNDPDAHDTLGWVFFLKNMPAAAVPHLEMAAKSKKTARNQYRLALAHRRLGHSKQSMDYLTAAVQMNPAVASLERVR
jgi:tetratricopeptide (TPR) repeat protein